MIPSSVQIRGGALPDGSGVYFYSDAAGKLLYIGKATSLKKRVGSYFVKAHDNRIAELVSKIARIDYVETPTVIEALVLEANQIKAHRPPFNILLRDDKSFLYLTITNETYPRPLLMRGLELERLGIDPFRVTLTEKTKKKFLAVYGPYTSLISFGSLFRGVIVYLRKSRAGTRHASTYTLESVLGCVLGRFRREITGKSFGNSCSFLMERRAGL